METLYGLRVYAVTSGPWFRAWNVSIRPVLPLAPNTVIFIVEVYYNANVQNLTGRR
jgi:hypothetical protein